MTAGRKLVALISSMAILAAVTWTVVGGMSVAQGQEKPVVIKRAHAGSFRPSFDKPIFILMLGTDSGARKYGRGGSYEAGRADSIHIIAINPQTKKATIVGIPRDSYVPIACGSSPNKINAAGFFGRAPCVVKTVENLSGGRIKFDYYMIGGFEQLENAVNQIGGVPVDVERPLGGRFTDAPSRSQNLRSGQHTLNGHDALAYSRNRHEYGRGDFDRTVHQGQVLLGGLTKARQLATQAPGKTLSFLKIMFKNMKSDIPLVEAFRLGLLALQIEPSNVNVTLLDGTTGNTSAGSSVLLTNPRRILDDIATDAVIG
jgi:polyisoprenyl-teichoic acid--peptidoglycan teichoic acid transferase